MARQQELGYIEHSWEIRSSGPARKVFRLTDKGRREYQRLGQTWQHLTAAVECATAITDLDREADVNYYKELTFQLRQRRLPEPRIVEILQEVRDLARESGQDQRKQFGSASAYAGKFPKGKSRSRAMKITITVLGIAIVIMGVDLARGLVTDENFHLGPVRVFFLLLAVQVITAIAAFTADHVPPRSSMRLRSDTVDFR